MQNLKENLGYFFGPRSQINGSEGRLPLDRTVKHSGRTRFERTEANSSELYTADVVYILYICTIYINPNDGMWNIVSLSIVADGDRQIEV